ncbi:MAG: protein kinase [Oscillospiraceae bacterium]|nr:protein kinase [Oscillospiraceae bacterium]
MTEIFEHERGNSFAGDFRKTFEGADLPPEIADRFHIIERLGFNEFGETFLVSEKLGGELYVLKNRIKSNFVDTVETNEAEFMSNLEHKGLPHYEKAIDSANSLYICRKYIKGVTLTEFLQSEKTTNTPFAVEILVSLCDILTYLHTQNPPVIHRDIKPSNIIINPDEQRVTLIDFGIARKFSADSKNDTSYLGTKNFAPPEQYGFAQTDCRTDIYALGIVMRCCLGGTPDRDVKIPDKSLEKIAAKCTALAPEARYKTAAAVKKALLNYKTRARRRVFAGVACVLAVLGLIFAGHAVKNYFDSLPALALAPNPLTDEVYADYDQYEYNKLLEFIRGGDNEQILQAQYPDFRAENPLMWRRAKFDVVWNDEAPKRVRGITITAIALTGALDLSGFTQLEFADINNTRITAVDLSACYSLVDLYCHENPLETLDLAGCSSLNWLSCFGNRLTALDVFDSPKLRGIYCHKNQIASLNLAGLSALELLSATENRLTELNTTDLTALNELHLGDNFITEIDLSNCPDLSLFTINNNRITSLDLSRNTRLETLQIGGNSGLSGMASLDLSDLSGLKYLWIYGNGFSDSDVIFPADSDLMYIAADGNNFANLAPFESFRRLCFLGIERNNFDFESADIRASIRRIQGVIDANTASPPVGYAPPEWVGERFGFEHENFLTNS